MPLAHTCPGCGQVLTHVRANYARDFRAPVVVCPECSFATVRRRHPIAAAIRLAWRCAWAVYGLAWRIALLSVLIAVSLFVAGGLAQALRDAGFSATGLISHLFGISPDPMAWSDLVERDGHITLVMALCWSILVGALLSGGLAHVRRRWLLWALFLASLVLYTWAETAYVVWVWLGAGEPPSAGVSSPLDYSMYRVSDLPTALAHPKRIALSIQGALTLMACAMLLGVPLGLMVRRAILRRDTRRFARKRVYLRSRRNLA